MGDDLDDMLLAAAGRKSSGGGSSKAGKKAPAAREREGSPSTSEDDDFDEDDEDEDEQQRGSKSGSKMPLKKRFEPGDRGDEDGYESDISYGSDLYRDDEDRRKLEELSELKREMELHNRYERRQNYKARKETERISREQQQQQQSQHQNQSSQRRSSSSAAATPGPPSSRIRSSGRDTTSKKTSALNELVAKRQKAQDSDQRKRAAAAAAVRSSSPVPSSDGESEEEDLSSRESNRSEALPSDDDEERASLPSNEEIKKITIRRSKLFKWFMEPFFEETIVGCFVRIGVGQSKSGSGVYRLYLVRSVDAKDPDKQYKFENRMTYKYLSCTSGGGDEGSPVKWQMARASDTAPSDEEISAWKSEVMKSGSSGGLVSKGSVAEKVAALDKVNSFVYSAAAVKQMVQEKKLTAKPIGEKERLAKELSVAEGRGDREQVERLQEKIREVEANAAKAHKSKNEKAERIEMMNRRNRFENFKNASELRPAAKIGEAGYDPFSRRWTRSQNYYKSEAPKSGAEQSEAAMAEKAKERETMNEAGKQESSRLGGGQQYSKMFHLHDFDLPISLAPLERFKGQGGAVAAYMERKRNVEARYGVRVENDGVRRHTLTVNDYKRRRGLL